MTPTMNTVTDSQTPACDAIIHEYERRDNEPPITRLGQAFDDMRAAFSISPEELAERSGASLDSILRMDSIGRERFGVGWKESAEPGISDVLRLAAFFKIPMEWVTRFLHLPDME